MLGGELCAETVDVVVVAANLDEVRAVDARRKDLLLFKIGRNEYVRRQTDGSRLRRDRVAQIARRGTGKRGETELARARRGHRDDAVLERVRWVRGVVLDVDVAQPERLTKPIGAHQRRPADRQAGQRYRAVAGSRWWTGQRQEIGVTPDVLPSRLDPPAQRGAFTQAAVVIGDLQWPEAALAHIQRLERVFAPTFLALQLLCRHKKTSAGPVAKAPLGKAPATSPRLLLEPDGIGTVCRLRGMVAGVS